MPWPFTTAPVPEPDAGITKDAVGEPDMPGTTADPDLGSLIRTAGSTIDPLGWLAGWLAGRPAGRSGANRRAGAAPIWCVAKGSSCAPDGSRTHHSAGRVQQAHEAR